MTRNATSAPDGADPEVMAAQDFSARERSELAETLPGQLRRMRQIFGHIEKLGHLERDWLMRRLAEVECADTAVGQVWSWRHSR